MVGGGVKEGEEKREEERKEREEWKEEEGREGEEEGFKKGRGRDNYVPVDGIRTALEMNVCVCSFMCVCHSHPLLHNAYTVKKKRRKM